MDIHHYEKGSETRQNSFPLKNIKTEIKKIK